MPCPADTTIQYNIRLHTDPQTTQVKLNRQLTFCLKINGANITGKVLELGVDLIGDNVAISTDVDAITLRFPWAPSFVTIRGFTFPDSGNRREILGRFIATDLKEAPVRVSADADPPEAADPPAPPPPPPPPGPDSGDTGTGTGTTT
jgi:hypothetical protein